MPHSITAWVIVGSVFVALWLILAKRASSIDPASPPVPVVPLW